MVETLLENELAIVDHENCSIIVYNDNVNNFQHVIKTFVEVLGCTEQQAEQLAMIIHSKGKANVKRGSFKELQPKCEKLISADLLADIE